MPLKSANWTRTILFARTILRFFYTNRSDAFWGIKLHSLAQAHSACLHFCGARIATKRHPGRCLFVLFLTGRRTLVISSSAVSRKRVALACTFAVPASRFPRTPHCGESSRSPSATAATRSPPSPSHREWSARSLSRLPARGSGNPLRHKKGTPKGAFFGGEGESVFIPIFSIF